MVKLKTFYHYTSSFDINNRCFNIELFYTPFNTITLEVTLIK